MRDKKGQVTIFIIIAILIVAILLVLFWPKVKLLVTPGSPQTNLKNCIQNDLKKAVEDISIKGGSYAPINSIMYQGDKIEYLCYSTENYKTCVMQQPLLKQHVEQEILAIIKPKLQSCVENMKTNAERQGYTITGNVNDVSVELVPNNVKVIANLNLVLTKDTRQSYDKVEASYKSNIYDLVTLSTSILNWEAHYGDSDILSYMLYYPDVKIEKYRQDDGSKIYILTDKTTEEKFQFATRSLVFPAGYGFT